MWPVQTWPPTAFAQKVRKQYVRMSRQYLLVHKCVDFCCKTKTKGHDHATTRTHNAEVLAYYPFLLVNKIGHSVFFCNSFVIYLVLFKEI